MTEHVERLTREEVMELMDIDPDFVADEFCRLSVELQRLQRQIIAKDDEIERPKARLSAVCRMCDGNGRIRITKKSVLREFHMLNREAAEASRSMGGDGSVWYGSSAQCPACHGIGVVWKEGE